MKKLLLPVFGSLLALSCSEKKPVSIHNDLFFDNLNGPVEKVEELPFTPDSTGNTGEMDSCCISILEYDEKGYRTVQAEKDRNERIKYGQIYASRYANGHVKEIRFIVDGNIVSILSSTLAADGSYSKSQIHDTSGKLISFYDSLEINAYGKIIVMRNFNPDSTPKQTVINNYKEQIFVGGSIKDASGKEIFSTQIKLNDKLDPSEIKEVRFMNNGLDSAITRRVYTDYDKHNNWIQSTEADDKGKTKRVLKRRITYSEK
jgi:hypothetical protein